MTNSQPRTILSEDKLTEKDTFLVNKNNSGNTSSVMEFLDNLTPIDNIPTNKDTNDEIGNNSEMLPERHFELTTPVTSVVPHSEDENLTTQTKKINDTNKKTMMMNNTDQKTCTETNLDSNIPQKAIPDSGVEGKRDDSDTNEMTNSEENSMKANLLQHDDSKLPNFPYKSVKFQDKNESTKKSFLNTQVETPDDYEMVVERDGRFDVVTHGDINAMIDKMKKLHTNGLKSGKKSNKPQRKQIEPKSCKLQIPKQESELEQSSNSASSCTYASPYALTEKQKLAVKDRLRLYEEKMRKVIEEQKEMEKKKKEVNETAFEVWLKQTKEKEIAIRKQEKLQEMESIKKEEEKKRIREIDFHRIWTQKKNKQIRIEKLFKKRKQAETDSVRKPRTREEINDAFAKWLENKHREKRSPKCINRQNKLFSQYILHHTKLIRNMTKNLNLNSSFRCNDPWCYAKKFI